MVTPNSKNKQDNIQTKNTLPQNTLPQNDMPPSKMTLDQIMDKTIPIGSKALDSSEMDIPIGNAFDKFAFMSNDLSNIMQKLPAVLCREGTDCHKKKKQKII